MEKGKILFRHDSFRKYQDKLAEDVYSIVSNREIALLNAPMGLGKTDAVVGAALSHAVEEKLFLLFLTPKISQHKIVLDVVEGINRKYGLSLRAIDLIGRRYMCAIEKLSSLDQDNFYSVCKKMREEELCPFYNNSLFSSKAEFLLDRIDKKILSSSYVFSYSFLIFFF